MNLYFIRHGNPDYSTDSITEKGKDQASKLAECIKDWKVDEVYHSKMTRSEQTGAYCCKKWKLTSVSQNFIHELCWGDMKGDAWASDSPWMINDRLIAEEHRYPEGDSWKQMEELKQDRIIEDVQWRCVEFDKFLKEHGYVREGQLYKAVTPNDKNIVFFCHGGLSCALISYLLNIPFFQFIAHVGLGETSVSKVRFEGKEGEYKAVQLEYLNDMHHLK